MLKQNIPSSSKGNSNLLYCFSLHTLNTVMNNFLLLAYTKEPIFKPNKIAFPPSLTNLTVFSSEVAL